MDLVSVWEHAWELQQASYTTHCHGLDHWVRVERNGLWLARHHPGVDELVVRLFAALHDCQRTHDGHDTLHGPRAARLVQGMELPVSPSQRRVLVEAIRTHTMGLTDSDDLTLQVCHDADRLDLGRVQKQPGAEYLCTPEAQDLAERDAVEELDEVEVDLTLPGRLRPTPRWDGWG